MAAHLGRAERCFGSLPFTLPLLVSVKGAPARTSWRWFAFTTCLYPAGIRPWMACPWKWSRLLYAARSYFLTGDSTGLHRLVAAFALFTLHSVLTQSVLRAPSQNRSGTTPPGIACPSGLFGSPWTLLLDFGVHDSQETRCGGCPLSDGTGTAAGALVLGSTRCLGWLWVPTHCHFG